VHPDDRNLTNGFWVGWLEQAARHGDDPKIILDPAPMIARMTPDNVKAAARRFRHVPGDHDAGCECLGRADEGSQATREDAAGAGHQGGAGRREGVVAVRDGAPRRDRSFVAAGFAPSA
jgi:hypothetical protein